MSETPVSPKQILAELRKFCEDHKDANGRYSQAKAAKALGVTAAQLSLTVNERVNVIPARILKKLGYESVVVYMPITKKGKAKKPVAKKPVAKKPTPKDARKPMTKAALKKTITDKRVVIQEKPKTAARETEAVVIDVMARD